jgi:hypothetical protein
LHEEVKSIENYCSDKFTELQASHNVLQTSNSAMLLQWHKLYRRQLIYEIRRFITSTLLTFDQIEFFLGYATQFSDGDMFRPCRKIFNDYSKTNGLALNRFLPNADTHFALFTTDNRGPLAEGNFVVHSGITLDDVSSAL